MFAICTNQQLPQRGGAVPDPVWVGSKWLLAFPRIPVTPGTLLHFFEMLPPERPQKGSKQLLQIRSPVISFSLLLPFSCPSSSPHCPPSLGERQCSSQPWPNLSLLCVRWKCDLAGQVSAMLHLLQMGSSKVLTTFALQIQSSWQLSLLELPPCRNTVTPSSVSSNMYTSTVQSDSPLLMLYYSPILVSKPPIPHLPILYLLSFPLHHRLLLLDVLLRLLPPLIPLILSGFAMECWRSSSQKH